MRVPAGLAFAACTLIWGTTWLAIKIGYDGLDAVWGASIRFLVAGGLLIPLVLARKVPLPRGRRQLGVVAFVGIAMFAIDYGLIYWGEQFLTSGLTAILFATMPLFVGVGSVLVIPSERMTPMHAVGVATGLVGLASIFLPDLRAGTSAVLPAFAIVASAVAAAATSVVVRRWGRDVPPLSLNASAMLLGGSILWLVSIATGERPSLPGTSGAWLSVMYLSIVGSIVSFLLYWNLLGQWPAHRAGLIPIGTPVVAVLTGFLFNHESLTPLQAMGSIVVMLGVAISLLPISSRASSAAPAAK